jgi:ABC-type dipeptide/oligopeptide/nickel transport system ATPase component
MSSMTNGFENSLALLLFNNTTIANIGDATGLVGSSTAGSTQLALAAVALTDADTVLTSNEIAYTGYARPTQARSSGGWTVSNDTVSNAGLIVFGQMTAGGPDTAVHLGLGFIGTGDVLRLHQDLNADLVINNGINPQFAVGALTWVFA